MNTLYDRRVIAQICFIFQLIKGKIISPPLLNKIDYRIYQRNFRNQEILVIDYNNNDPYNVMRQKFNEYLNVNDMNQSLFTLKNNLKQLFKSQL
jgi:Uma2 family endonuclease